MKNSIVIKGAKEHNLKNIDVTLPRNKMIVFTGLSGSGKSSLAFDTIYAEGQRRYVESLSAYARQFLGQMEKPDVEYIEGLSPAISIDQKTTNRNPRSTVGTVTEIYDYLRLLYARIGVPHCPICGEKISSQTLDQIVDEIMKEYSETKFIVLAPLVRGGKGEHRKTIDMVRREGFVRVRIDGEIHDVNDDIKLLKNVKHTIEIVIDRLKIKDGIEARLREALELADKYGDGLFTCLIDNKEKTFSTKLSCSKHQINISELEPRMFSFNSPFGACSCCNGLGIIEEIDPDLLIDSSLSISEGCIAPIFSTKEHRGFYMKAIEALAKYHGEKLTTPFYKLSDDFKNELLYGSKNILKYTYISKTSGTSYNREHRFEGVVTNLERRYRDTESNFIKEKIHKYMTFNECNQCNGSRLKVESRSVFVGGINIHDFTCLSILESLQFIKKLNLSKREALIGEQILKEIVARLEFLVNVGLGYLCLSRSASTLSGGESQRIRLATQIGSGLVGVLYILDEPSIGLHQRDNEKLLKTLRHLTDIGNTLIIVEHDEDTMYASDMILDIGPGAGTHGGEIIAQGDIKTILKSKNSITADYLSGRKKIEVPSERREANGKYLELQGARANNLKNINVSFPLGKFICVTGVSGSGKSSLINEVLYNAVKSNIYGSNVSKKNYDDFIGFENIDKVIDIDQSPIGRTPRSNPATYTGVFTHIRELFSNMQEAKVRGYTKGRFSFNVKGGRCEACNGDGIIKIEMHFLPDVYVQCEACKGKRYNRETLEVKYRGKNIYEVLDMTVEEGLDFFKNIPPIKKQLETLYEVGLEYIKLGQPSTQLSGGEAQRIKLASELSKRSTGKTLYILDEPTTGLHFADVDKLIRVLNKLVDNGNTVLVIEHNLDIIKQSDYIIDLGPEGGLEGGEIIAEGSPEEICKVTSSYTGKFLKRILE